MLDLFYSACKIAVQGEGMILRILRRIFARKAKADLKIFTDNIDNILSGRLICRITNGLRRCTITFRLRTT